LEIIGGTTVNRTVLIPIVISIVALIAIVMMFGGGGGGTAGPAPGLSPTDTATPAGS